MNLIKKKWKNSLKKPKQPKHTIFYFERYGEKGMTIFKGYGIINSRGRIIGEFTTREAAENALKLLSN